MIKVTTSVWDEYISKNTNAHLLQTASWGELKSNFGWRVVRILQQCNEIEENSQLGAQILFRYLPLGFSIAYIPMGPVNANRESENKPEWNKFWIAVDNICRENNSIFLKLEPDYGIFLYSETIESVNLLKMPPPGFSTTNQSIQPVRTILIDLTGQENQILSRMKQKTRYNIRLALKKGVDVIQSSDINTFHELMLLTGDRDKFGIHSNEYYRQAFELFNSRGECQLLLAEYQGEPLAGIMVFARGNRAWYIYGASSNRHRNTMPNYLLQWEAMRWAKGIGCTEYDFWGIPDEQEEILESNFQSRSDGLWGVYRFKRGFGGHLYRHYGPWDRIYNTKLYSLYKTWVKFRYRNSQNTSIS
jgi:lipid II:glycine glycyltransferase (peptidoglycan interpeptide bridge formation enzyme)